MSYSTMSAPSSNTNFVKNELLFRRLTRLRAAAAPGLSGSMSCRIGLLSVITVPSRHGEKPMNTAAESNMSRYPRPS